jgi:hypothetical protein
MDCGQWTNTSLDSEGSCDGGYEWDRRRRWKGGPKMDWKIHWTGPEAVFAEAERTADGPEMEQ